MINNPVMDTSIACKNETADSDSLSKRAACAFDHLVSKVEGDMASITHFVANTNLRVGEAMARKTVARLELARKTILNMRPGQWRTLQMRNGYERRKMIEFIETCEISGYLRYQEVSSDQIHKKVQKIISKAGDIGPFCGSYGCSICASKIEYIHEQIPVQHIRVFRSVK